MSARHTRSGASGQVVDQGVPSASTVTQRPRALSADTKHIKDFRHAARLTGIVGVVFSILFVVSVFSFSGGPHPNATDADVTAYYQTSSQQLVRIGGLYLLPLAAIAFLWFVSALHAWVQLSGRPIDRLMSTVQMLGGVSFVTLSLAAAASATVASFSYADYVLTPDLARQFPLFGRTLLAVFGMRMAALFVMSTAKLGQGSGLLPRWFQWISFAVALALFASATLNVWLTLIFPAWIVLLCGMIWLRRAMLPTEATQGASS